MWSEVQDTVELVRDRSKEVVRFTGDPGGRSRLKFVKEHLKQFRQKLAMSEGIEVQLFKLMFEHT